MICKGGGFCCRQQQRQQVTRSTSQVAGLPLRCVVCLVFSGLQVKAERQQDTVTSLHLSFTTSNWPPNSQIALLPVYMSYLLSVLVSNYVERYSLHYVPNMNKKYHNRFLNSEFVRKCIKCCQYCVSFLSCYCQVPTICNML